MLVERFTGRRQRYTYVPDNRIGDHICYYSDLRKMRAHYPQLGYNDQSGADDLRDRRGLA